MMASANGTVTAVSKANRVKGQVRTKYRFQCESGHPATGQAILFGPIRFKHSDARRDWDDHNIEIHAGRKSTMTKDEAVKLLTSQRII